MLGHPETDVLYYAAFGKCVNLRLKDKSSQSNITVVFRMEISAAVCEASSRIVFIFSKLRHTKLMDVYLRCVGRNRVRGYLSGVVVYEIKKFLFISEEPPVKGNVKTLNHLIYSE